MCVCEHECVYSFKNDHHVKPIFSSMKYKMKSQSCRFMFPFTLCNIIIMTQISITSAFIHSLMIIMTQNQYWHISFHPQLHDHNDPNQYYYISFHPQLNEFETFSTDKNINKGKRQEDPFCTGCVNCYTGTGIDHFWMINYGAEGLIIVSPGWQIIVLGDK